MLCDHLEGWGREGGREGDARGRGYGDICIPIANSLCLLYSRNKHNILKQLYSNKDVKKKTKKRSCVSDSLP